MITIQITKPRTRWVALDLNNNVIVEGMKPETVVRKAEKITTDFIMCWVPKKGVTYIF